jgi:ankyrin repeat protein
MLGNAQQLRTLLQGAANPQALLTQLHGGFTALHVAAHNGHVACMEILLAAGSVDQQLLAGRVPENQNALMLAILTGKSTAAVELLLSQHCVREQLEAADEAGWTAVMYACCGGHTACVRLLLAAGHAATQVQASNK